MSYIELPGPAHEHDCAQCIPLGTIEHVHGLTPGGVPAEDLYACPRPDGDYDLIHRYGHGPDYQSLPLSVTERLYVPNRVNATPSTLLFVEIRHRLRRQERHSA